MSVVARDVSEPPTGEEPALGDDVRSMLWLLPLYRTSPADSPLDALLDIDALLCLNFAVFQPSDLASADLVVSPCLGELSYSLSRRILRFVITRVDARDLRRRGRVGFHDSERLTQDHLHRPPSQVGLTGLAGYSRAI